ncbi:type I restriction enzyme HsdR N-terminal domain-containing protein [Rhodohalobacter halophilus]|uniref:type I restriction enzyme HsdR N-terminal domain-containing protein n=1 Tax=Rhodohalobacter halophilus TaxID=1812810 RepID=UPI00083FA1FC|nr:type I restriction enzyme HsdR N-terminal domain-containing protein [Rhodohalobacter halophilus]
MISFSKNHFPIIRSAGDKKQLFNPVLKKRFKIRPEERVRLKWVEFLLLQTDWPKSRIGFEAPVKLPQEENALRADLILYNKAMKPNILIECKAESVKLNSTVAEQTARYNQAIGASYICLTNGVSDFWYRVENGSVKAIESHDNPDFPLEITTPLQELNRDITYWEHRGFCAGRFAGDPKNILQQSITHFWSEEIDWPVNYLDFPGLFLDFRLNQYYRVPVVDRDQKLAISFMGTESGSSHLTAILNDKGRNRGILSVNLGKLSDQQADSAELLMNGNHRTLDAAQHLPLFKHGFSPKVIEQLPHYLMRFFV